LCVSFKELVHKSANVKNLKKLKQLRLKSGTSADRLCVFGCSCVLMKADLIYRKESKWVVVVVIFRIHGSEV